MLDPSNPRLKPALTSGTPVGVIWFTLGHIPLIEIACRHDPDAIVVDMQHGLFDRLSLEAAIGISSAPVMVRTRDDHPASIGEALDAGAEGIIVPLVESGAAAHAVARACRYPPDGNRSGGGIRPLADFAGHIANANGAIVAGVMIETAAGVEAAEEIARSGIDFVFIGTGDLSLSLGAAPGSREHEAACQTILAACRKAGIPCGAFAMDAAGGTARAAQGFALSVSAIDSEIYEKGMAAALGEFGAGTAATTTRQARAARRGRAAAPAGTSRPRRRR
ncbi:aldolase/citrate lyase family protein [Acuticoccus sp. M5D2P5]|uniref:HpcH/HpaI aldolase family protein n=1 Tax=Acuticoccus kalidii TaxID=2910977 RepID=UPI001F2F7EBD|nr:aldolase/citrate lyase family protein [Acuticoccus kalidii]MCF3932851.1 aldolase/citrate lyase family protein [Acuticoccus kalidii]